MQNLLSFKIKFIEIIFSEMQAFLSDVYVSQLLELCTDILTFGVFVDISTHLFLFFH